MRKKIFLFNPPVGFFQRGEDRCQVNIDGSTSTALRACNDLGYMAAIAKKSGYAPKIKDYPAEKLKWKDYIRDFKEFMPDIAVMSITTATIEKDMEAFELAKSLNPEVITIAKGAHFSGCSCEELNKDIYKVMDYAISGEAEFIITDLIVSEALPYPPCINQIKGIFYWNEDKSRILKTLQPEFIENLDSLPFPARDLMNNKLYKRPDTGKPLATISVSRGCAFSCIYCLTPVVSGKKTRKRSAKNIVDEIQECVKKYNIKNFFFKADTFTIDKKWVTEVCEEILARKLKIEWVANSRVKPLELETLKLMKKAGCWLIAVGIESGSQESLEKMKKGITKEEAKQAVKWIKQAGLKTFGYYLIGFPWETKKHIEETVKFAKELDCDYIEIHIAVPFEGTELYERVKNTELLKKTVTGHDAFINPVIKTEHLTTKELLELKNKAIKEICLNPKYIIKTLGNIRSINEFVNYTKFGIRMTKNLFKTN
ncbi:MAG: B12-binding domain-containing radical SAM protein [bacterium]